MSGVGGPSGTGSGAVRGGVRRAWARVMTTSPSADSAAGANPIARSPSSSAAGSACAASTVGASRRRRRPADRLSARISLSTASSSQRTYAEAAPIRRWPCLRATSSMR